jgi:bifunctional non-homologous end joining protein LigD
VIEFTNLDRVMWPATGFSKGDLIDYYRGVGEVMVRHLAQRPTMLARFPEGIHRPGWGQWECRGRPAWMASAVLRMKDGREVETCLFNDVPSLLWAANQGTIEFHPYLGTADSFEEPVAVVFDLDPGPPAGLLEAADVALRIRAVLDTAGLLSVVKASGGEGLHVVVPLNAPATYRATKGFARALAAELAATIPELAVDRMSKSLRSGRVLVDWAQNDERKQTVAAYSLRITPVPAVSAPLTWEEVEQAARERNADGLRHSPETVLRRLAERGDLFAAAAETRQALPAAPTLR